MYDIETFDLLDIWKTFIDTKTPHASLRIGDAELVVAAHETILTMDFVRKLCPWYNDPLYTGVVLPNKIAREQLIESIRLADFVGYLDQNDSWAWKPLYDMVREFYDFQHKKTFYAFSNFYLSKHKPFYDTFKDSKVLLVGAKSNKFKEVLERRYGWTGIVGVVDCSSWLQLEQAKQQMSFIDFDIAFIGCGTSAKILAVHARSLGKVGIDFGSGADTCIQSDQSGVYSWDWGEHPKYYQPK